MKRQYISFSIILMASMLTACRSDEPGDVRLPDGKYPLSLTASIGSPQTRAAGMEQWKGGEDIAVNIGDYTGKYTIQADGKVTVSDTPYYWQNTDKATVRAWYPCDLSDKTYDISDQSLGFADFDFLYAETEGSYAAPVRLVFSHRMAKVSYTLVKGNGITDTEFSSASVSLFGDKSVTVSGGKITSVASSQTDEIKPCHDASSHSGSAVMIPQNMTGKQLIKVTVGGNDFIYTPDTEGAGNLQGGYHYSYTINVKANGIEVTAAKGGTWTDGGSEDVTSKEVKQTFTATDLKLGDYFYSDGTYSDGGLRSIYTDGAYRIDASVVPASNKSCIGIVFYAGQHDTDTGDYTATGIGQEKCHGYVVALTDAGVLLSWERGPIGEYELSINTSTGIDDWQGYSNSLKFHEFVNIPINKYAGWEMKHFPAAFACETYGKDANGTYGQQQLAAPINTTGWFLPSYGQLKHLYMNRSFLSARMTDAKNMAPADCNYKDNIKWFSTSGYYWSSTEMWDCADIYAWDINFDNGDPSGRYKSGDNYVRAVLAF